MADEPFRVRASSWGSLFDCAHRFEAIHILGMRSASGPRAALGTAIHAGTAHFDAQRARGEPGDAMEAAEEFMHALRNPREEVNWRHADLTMAQAEKIGLTLLARYCADVAPHFHYVAVEMETKPMVIDCGSGVKIQLTGTMDRARVVAGEFGVGIADLKSGTRATEDDSHGNRVAKTKGHAAQIGTYELLYEHTTGELVTRPGVIIGLNTGNRPDIAIGEIGNAREQMVGTEDSPGLLKYATVMFQTGLFPPNPSSVMCSEQYCPRWNQCLYHE